MLNTNNRLSLIIKRLGPLTNTKIVLGDITLLIGAPNTGKSYILRAIYTSLLLLDRHLLHICKPRLQPSVNIVENGIRLISKLIASAVDAADKPTLPPSRVANKFGVNVSRYTVHERSQRYIRVGFRIKKESRKTLASFNAIEILIDLINSLRSCITGSLIPKNSEFYIENARHLTERVRYSGLGTMTITLLRDTTITTEPCTINVEEVKVEVADINGNLDPRGVEIAVEVLGKCRVDELEKMITATISKESAKSRIQRKISMTLVKQVYKVAKRELRSLINISDIVYVPFAKSLLLNLRLALGLRLAKATKLLKLLYSKETMYAAIFLSRLDEGMRLFTESDSFHVPALGYIARTLIKGTLKTEANKLYYYNTHYSVTIPMHLASALASETSALLLALNSIKANSNTLILLEEPETQLHPRLQLAMGITLAAIPSLLNARLVASTHSDLLAFILAYINAYKPSTRTIAKILAEATDLREDDESVRIIAENAAKLSALSLHTYLLANGKATIIPAETILKEMPSLSEASSIALKAMLKYEEI